MYVDLTPEQKKLQAELRTYLGKLVTPAVMEEIRGSEGGGPRFRGVLRELGKDGWLGVGWPKEYGGRAMSAIEQYIFAEEIQRTGFPLPFLTINSVGADDHALRHRRAEETLPAEDPGAASC